MKTYNKSKIMKEAHYWRTVLGYTMSEAMKMAWRNAKKEVARNEEAKVKNEADRLLREKVAKSTKVADMSYLANTLTSYYANNAYNMD